MAFLGNLIVLTFIVIILFFLVHHPRTQRSRLPFANPVPPVVGSTTTTPPLGSATVAAATVVALPVWIYVPQESLLNYQLLNISIVLRRFHNSGRPVFLINKTNFGRYVGTCYPINRLSGDFVEDFIKYKALEMFGGLWVHVDTLLLLHPTPSELEEIEQGNLVVFGRFLHGKTVLPDDRFLMVSHVQHPVIVKINAHLTYYLKHNIKLGAYGATPFVKYLLLKNATDLTWIRKEETESFDLQDLLVSSYAITPSPFMVHITGQDMFNSGWFLRADFSTLILKKYQICQYYRQALGVTDDKMFTSLILEDQIKSLWRTCFPPTAMS